MSGKNPCRFDLPWICMGQSNLLYELEQPRYDKIRFNKDLTKNRQIFEIVVPLLFLKLKKDLDNQGLNL